MQRMRARRPGSAGAGSRLDVEQVVEREERLDQVRHGVLRKAKYIEQTEFAEGETNRPR